MGGAVRVVGGCVGGCMRVYVGAHARVCIHHGGATTTGPDATYPPAICQNSGGGAELGGGSGRGSGGVLPGVGGGSGRGSGGRRMG